MRGYKSIIQEAELLAMSPESVADFLKKRATQSMDELDQDPVDEEAEETLRGRSNPLIDLALARYARFMETLRPIFQNSQPCVALRLAVLSNGTRWPSYTNFPVELFGERKQEALERAGAWLAEAPSEELQALFENPRIDDDFLSDILKRSKPWDALSDERLATIVANRTLSARISPRLRSSEPLPDQSRLCPAAVHTRSRPRVLQSSKRAQIGQPPSPG